MKAALLTLLLLINISANDTNSTCYMRGIFKVCGDRETRILSCKGCAWTTYGDYQTRDKQLAVFVRLPEDATGPGWDEYFILDYKNMMVYDGDCYQGGLAATEDNNIIYQDSSGNFRIFKKEDFDHCKQPLKVWLAKPYEPYK